MAAPLDGIKVLEVANWLAAPAAAALMADMGADVIKIEPPTGDIFRGFVLRSIGYDFDFPTNYGFEVDNRGKRSVVVDLDKPGGADLVRRLAADCDIFLTNLVQRRRTRYGLTFDDVIAANPKVIYASFSGYGAHGPDEDRPGFDFAAFWARSGIMSTLGEPDSAPPMCRGGQGDHTTALNILASVLAALRMRDKTGEGQHVEVTLQGTGMYTIAGDFSAALTSKKDPARISRKTPVNPIWNTYRCGDDRWILTVMPVAFPSYWPKFCQIIEKPEWADDERWNDLPKLREQTPLLVGLIDEIMATKPFAHWAKLFDEYGTDLGACGDDDGHDFGPASPRDGLDYRTGTPNVWHLRNAEHAVSPLRQRHWCARACPGAGRSHLRSAERGWSWRGGDGDARGKRGLGLAKSP